MSFAKARVRMRVSGIGSFHFHTFTKISVRIVGIFSNYVTLYSVSPTGQGPSFELTPSQLLLVLSREAHGQTSMLFQETLGMPNPSSSDKKLLRPFPPGIWFYPALDDTWNTEETLEQPKKTVEQAVKKTAVQPETQWKNFSKGEEKIRKTVR